MRFLGILCFLIGPAMLAAAEDYSTTISRIVNSNPSVKTLAARTEADIQENHTGLNLANPELELSYQWGSPAEVPDKKTIDLSQSFDFATLSGGKRRVAEAKDAVAKSALDAARRDVAAEADMIMTEIVFRSRIALHYDSALNLLHRTLDAAELAFEKQEMTIIDVNSVKMELSALEAEATINNIDLASLKARLSSLAGGTTLDWRPDQYFSYELPLDFADWCRQAANSSPEVAAARAELSLADREISLRKSENLPSFSLGYTSELVTDANYYGATLGVELPLWANAGRVKAARAARSAAQLSIDNAILDFSLSQRALYDKAISLRKLDDTARRLFKESDIHLALYRLYSEGQLSSHDYLSQLQPLLQLQRRAFEAEFEYQKALAEFRAATIR
ncbi:MAG: TolC family protein [Muribaculaceae bacterium]|nr:TolC family protein [Muribaculaceae bacterium]